MSTKKILKCVVLSLFTIFLCAIVLMAFKRQMDITPLKIVKEEELNCFSEYVFKDYSEYIMNAGTPAAIDKETSTIYVSVKKEALSDMSFLNEIIEIRKGNGLVFYVSEANCAGFISENQPLKVIVAEKDSVEYMKYDLILTTLPVIDLRGVDVGVDESGRILSEGDFSLWNGHSPSQIQASLAQWHFRGNSSMKYDKKSFKLSLKRYNEDNDMSLLGLGGDDEWILNAMATDDTHIREKLIMDVWNQMQSTATYNMKMSSGEYVEVVVNGEYKGLYLLQRQINEKYLELDKDVALVRGTDNTWLRIPEIPEEAYHIIYSSELTASEIYDCMSGLFYMNDFSLVNKNNWIDISLFIQFGRLTDNAWVKNTYYIIDSKKGEKICILLWDTDLSLGVDWPEAKVEYCFTPGVDVTRVEHEMMLAERFDISNLMALRWKELRDGVLSYDNLSRTMQKYVDQINVSGVAEREKNKNGLFHNGEDSYEKLILFIQEQLQLMDELYLKK